MKQRKMTPVDAKTEQHFAHPTAPKKNASFPPWSPSYRTRRSRTGSRRLHTGVRARRDRRGGLYCDETAGGAPQTRNLQICCGKTTPG